MWTVSHIFVHFSQDDDTPLDPKYDIDGKYAPKVIFQGNPIIQCFI